MQKWRVIDTGGLSGPKNMALDDALLQAFDPSRSLLVLLGCRLFHHGCRMRLLGLFNPHEQRRTFVSI